MTMREFPVERLIEQVRDGIHYKGYVKIVDTIFDYELVFRVPIADLGNVEPANEVHELRDLFQITVMRGNAKIELADEEYMFFMSMVVQFAEDFYNIEQTRSSNEGKMGEMLRGTKLMALFGAKMSIGMKCNDTCGFHPALCERLNSPKFGCSLAI